MRPLSLLSYSQCRHTLFKASPDSCMTLASLSFRRQRSGGNSKKNKYAKQYEGRRLQKERPYNSTDANFPNIIRPKVERPSTSSFTFDTPKVDPNNIPAFFEAQVKQWTLHQWLPARLESFGVPQDEVRPLLDAFDRAVRAGELSTPEGHQKYVLDRFVCHIQEEDPIHAIDTIYTTILYTWASEEARVDLLRSVGLSQATIDRIQSLAQAGDRWYPADEFPEARRHHRKVIMHVGPTNSGKTHNALRALAAAGTGVYAGPLRLLAHEIWERLNLGEIVPAGIEEEPPKTTTVNTDDPDTALDVVTVKKRGNPKYAKACNMRTGEEQRIVDDAAPLIACTVEMLNMSREYDVAVLDEIQMIGDSERGGAWTTALLGVCAKEVHLCGEETAVPVVEALLKDTGDELIVNRYERLSPLTLQEETLDGDWTKVKKGDCIVTFARGPIFSLKRQIEKRTPFRCAVVYGRLPPEIRSEQAALFNDSDSGYDILIGSDAIGMGLNLKIGRVIFSTTQKWQGSHQAPLSISQTKQIAGRAGRYGLQGNDHPGGYVTAFLPQDIPHIKKALEAGPRPLATARIGLNSSYFQAFALALPPDASTKTIFNANYYISRIPAYLRQETRNPNRIDPICNFIDSGLKMPGKDALMYLMSPLPSRDPIAMEIVEKFLAAYQDNMEVDLWKHLEGSPLIANLEQVERLHAQRDPGGMHPGMIEQLESLHKSLVLYVWMSFRRPLAWHSVEEVGELKQRTEKAMDWGLQALTRSLPGQEWQERATHDNEASEVKEKLVYRGWYTRKAGISQKMKMAQQQKLVPASPHAN